MRLQRGSYNFQKLAPRSLNCFRCCLNYRVRACNNSLNFDRNWNGIRLMIFRAAASSSWSHLRLQQVNSIVEESLRVGGGGGDDVMN